MGDLRRHEEAIAATQEAVDIYRHLMERSSDAVLPALATTLSTHSEVLAGAQRHAEAAAAVHDALTMTAALAERDLQEFGDVARERRQYYRSECEKAGIAPDTALLERIARTVGAGDNTAQTV